MSLLSVERVSCNVAAGAPLAEVDLRVDEGEAVALIGPSRAGKSTFLKMVAGLVPVIEGRVRFDGRNINRARAHERVRQGIGLVPQERRVFPSLSVEENLLVGAYRGRPGPWDLRTVTRVFPALGAYGKRSAAMLPGPEQQLLAIGRALMTNPRLLMLDELSLGPSPALARQLGEAIRAITSAGTAVLFVEQNLDRALTFADRLYCLLKGRVTLAGSPADFSAPTIAAAYRAQ
ncbi:MAG TPA: ABC transporter ATP-binding protein [Candidatus Limnocylindria bacterium]|nr:ABC transporter ATP-binding protein [Candidatus Limnocylindria bacterium]